MATTPTPDIPPGTVAPGGQPLSYKMDGDVKVFELTASKVRWSLFPDVSVVALAYNGQVPGPIIKVTQGDKGRVILHNRLDEPYAARATLTMPGIWTVSVAAQAGGATKEADFDLKVA